MKDPHVYDIVKRGTLLLCGAAVLLLIFASGVEVGSRKADFDERYWRPGADRGTGVSRMGMLPELPGGHGASGTVVSVSGSGFVIAAPDKSEKVVLVNSSTTMRRFRGDASTTDIQVGDTVTVLGTPNTNGQIEAVFVRVAPSESIQQ